jgi:hypothetical protein
MLITIVTPTQLAGPIIKNNKEYKMAVLGAKRGNIYPKNAEIHLN